MLWENLDQGWKRIFFSAFNFKSFMCVKDPVAFFMKFKACPMKIVWNLFCGIWYHKIVSFCDFGHGSVWLTLFIGPSLVIWGSNGCTSLNILFFLLWCQLKQFKTDNAEVGFGSGTLALDQSIERTMANIKWIGENKENVLEWFKAEADTALF